MNPDSACGVTDWSPLATAAPLSQLAGVLAAVVFAGIVLVLTIPSPGALRVGTLQFFFAGFVILGMDSFAFALLAGDTSTICTRVWLEFIAASGMLVVGACAVINGVAWLVATYLRPQQGRSRRGDAIERDVARLDVSVRWAIHGITFVTLVLLSTSVMDYMSMLWRGGPISGWVTMTLTIPPYLLIVGAVSGVIWQIASSRDSSISSHVLLGIIGYSLVASLVVGISTSTPASIWASIPTVIGVLLLAVLVIPPVPILVAMAQANPGLPQGGVH